jgi:hypothetical protein
MGPKPQGGLQPTTLDEGLQALAQSASAELSDASSHALLRIFVAHCVLLPSLPVSARAQSLPALPQELQKVLVDKFLPAVFVATRGVADRADGRWLDVDGRVFAALLRFLLAGSELSLADAVGSDIAARADAILSSAGLQPDPAELDALRRIYPLPTESQTVVKRAAAPEPPRGLLRFRHPVLDDALAEIDAAADEQDSDEEAGAQPDYMRFGRGRGTVFSDTAHWCAAPSPHACPHATRLTSA